MTTPILERRLTDTDRVARVRTTPDGDVELEPGDAPGKVALLRRLREQHGLRKNDTDLVSVPPDNMGAQGALLLRDEQVDHVGGRHRVGEDQTRAVARHVADQAVERAAAVVEVDCAAQKALLARDLAAFGGGSFCLVSHSSKASRRALTTSLPVWRCGRKDR